LGHKTRLSKLRAERKGFSSIIGAIFMVLIVWVLASGYFIYTLSQNTMYNEAMRARNQEEADRRSENVVAVNGSYSVSGNQVTVKVVLENAGSAAVQIINLWVSDTTLQRYSNTIPSLDINLKPGDVLYLTDSEGINVTIQGASSADNFVAWFVTGRGNVVPVEIAPPPEPEHLPISTTGFFSLDWFYLQYTARYNPTPSDAAVISKSRRYVALYINVTNNGDEAMAIKSTSLIMLLIEWQEPLFYIVKSLNYPSGSGTPTITKYNDTTPITIGSHQSQILTFAAKSAAVVTWAWGDSLPVGISSGSTPEGSIVMTALVYTMQSEPTKTYAQSLSFRALVLTS
jgi:archaellum component FlaF (FlaF/FlaG flagellin family)